MTPRLAWLVVALACAVTAYAEQWGRFFAEGEPPGVWYLDHFRVDESDDLTRLVFAAKCDVPSGCASMRLGMFADDREPLAQPFGVGYSEGYGWYLLDPESSWTLPPPDNVQAGEWFTVGICR